MRPDQLATLLDFLEELVDAKIALREVSCAENMLSLTKARTYLEDYIKEIFEIKE